MRASHVVETRDVQKVRHKDGIFSKTINGFRVFRAFQDRLSNSFAKVKLCEEEDTGRMFAMKVFRKLPLRGQREFLREGEGMKVRTGLDKVYGELNLMKEICHPNCIRLIAIFDEEHENGKIYAVMELVSAGPVMEWHEEDRRFRAPEGPLIPESTMRTYLSDLLHSGGTWRADGTAMLL